MGKKLCQVLLVHSSEKPGGPAEQRSTGCCPSACSRETAQSSPVPRGADACSLRCADQLEWRLAIRCPSASPVSLPSPCPTCLFQNRKNTLTVVLVWDALGTVRKISE